MFPFERCPVNGFCHLLHSCGGGRDVLSSAGNTKIQLLPLGCRHPLLSCVQTIPTMLARVLLWLPAPRPPLLGKSLPVNGSVPPSITDSSRTLALTCILQLYTFQFVGSVVPSLVHILFRQQHSVPDCQRVSQTAEPHAVFSTQLLSFQQ